MRKVVYLFIVSSCLTSCTIEDVINYLNGQTSSLTEQQKAEVEAAKSNPSNTSVLMTTSSEITPNPEDMEQERDKGNISPPR